VIEITNLKKSYGEEYALRGLSFSIPQGQIVGFLGPNGAGKSTTMRILSGYVPYSHGSVKINNLEVSKNLIEIKKLIGYLPENNPQYDDMMVYESLLFIADIRVSSKEKKNKIDKAIERCGLQEVIYKDIAKLSKGFRQRLGLAQAILHEPEILILDEPTSGLDPNQIIEIRKLIKKLSKYMTILMSTHILQEAQNSSERILIINKGLLVADDTPDELLTNEIILEVDAERLDPDSLRDALGNIIGIRKVAYKKQAKTVIFMLDYENDPRKAIFELIVAKNLTLLEFKIEKISLEETFGRLTKGFLQDPK
jgi:ABC-2 type transport system ATP-binding protein